MEDIDAISPLFHHPAGPLDLPLDFGKPGRRLPARFGIDHLALPYYPTQVGYMRQYKSVAALCQAEIVPTAIHPVPTKGGRLYQISYEAKRGQWSRRTT